MERFIKFKEKREDNGKWGYGSQQRYTRTD